MSNAIQTIDNEANHLIIYCLNCIRHGRNATYEPGLIKLVVNPHWEEDRSSLTNQYQDYLHIANFCTTAIERFSLECRKVIGFAFTTLRDWLKRFAPLFHPIRSKATTNCDALACIFPRFASATCNYFEF